MQHSRSCQAAQSGWWALHAGRTGRINVDSNPGPTSGSGAKSAEGCRGPHPGTALYRIGCVVVSKNRRSVSWGP
jgi:hypothetical protein